MYKHSNTPSSIQLPFPGPPAPPQHSHTSCTFSFRRSWCFNSLSQQNTQIYHSVNMYSWLNRQRVRHSKFILIWLCISHRCNVICAVHAGKDIHDVARPGQARQSPSPSLPALPWRREEFIGKVENPSMHQQWTVNRQVHLGHKVYFQKDILLHIKKYKG